jgi:hypothetical protein
MWQGNNTDAGKCSRHFFLPVKDLKPSDPTYVYTTSENITD